MDISYYEDLNKVTIADFKVAIYELEEEMKRCLKNRNIKGYLTTLKVKLKLTKLLNKKSSLVAKENSEIRKQR